MYNTRTQIQKLIVLNVRFQDFLSTKMNQWVSPFVPSILFFLEEEEKKRKQNNITLLYKTGHFVINQI